MMSFFRGTNGSVNIFLIIVFTAIFFFNAIFIDYARILVAKKQTEDVLRAGVRSFLSTYDQSLKEEFGLFATELSNENKETFQQVINQNLSIQEGDFNFASLTLEPSATFIEGEYALANHDTFEKQILEKMKYSGPINLTVELIDRFKDMSTVLQEAADLTTTLSKMEEEYNKREVHLNQAVHNLLHASSLVGDGISYDSLSNQHQKYLSYATDDVNHAKIANERIITLLKQRKTNGESKNLEKVMEWNEITNDTEELMVFKEFFFFDFQAEIVEQNQRFQDILNAEEEYMHYLNEANSLEGKLPSELERSLREKNNQLNRLIESYKSLYIYPNNRIEQRNKLIENLANKLDKQTKKKHENETIEGLEVLNQVIQTMKEIDKLTVDFNQVINRTRYYRFYNEGKEENQPYFQLETSPKAANLALHEMTALLSELANILEGSRNELLINEYAFTHFNHLNPSELKLLKGDTILKVDKDKLLDFLDIENQEIEFIIYGKEDLGGNISSTLTDIFIIRLAVHTAEGFFDPKVRALGHPIAILAGAIAYGVNHALLDMTKLLEGKNIYFSNRFLRVSLGYYDHLRFLFLLHNKGNSGIKNRLSRIQGLIDFRTGLNLSNQYTYAVGHTTTTLDLWFLPGVFKALEVGNIIDGKINGRRYTFSNTIGMDY